jgi:hypothetical protein
MMPDAEPTTFVNEPLLDEPLLDEPPIDEPPIDISSTSPAAESISSSSTIPVASTTD